jgi:hypothetical protein
MWRFGDQSSRRETETCAAMSFSGVREERLKTPLPKSPPPKSPDAPSPAKAVLHSPSFEAPNALDAQFSALVHDIQQRLALLARAPTIRVEKWLRKLHDPVSNVTWKKLRNDYARLLRHNLSLGATSPPFDKAPDDGPLRNLLPDEKARFKGDGFGDARGAAKKKQSASSKTLFDASSTKTKTKTTTSYDSILDETEAETALRDLLRRANVAGAPRPLGAAEIATAVPPPLQGLFENDSANPFADVDRVAKDDERKDSTGVSREMRAFIAAEGVGGGNDEFEESVASKNAPVADVVAALGAEREKCKELEWRLRRAETALETCRRELNETRLAAHAMRDLKAEEIREIRASHKRELDRLIAHFERRRAEVHGPRVATSMRVAGVDTSAFAYKPRTSTSYDASKENRRLYRLNSERETEGNAAEKEKDFFAYLEAFQRNTGELRKRATISGAE